MTASLLVGFLMVVVTVVIHFFGIYGLSRLLEARGHRLRPQDGGMRLGALVIVIVLCLFALHTVQIWLYALLYLALGEFQTMEAALYYSTASFTTVGYGEIVQKPPWRLLGAIESANGFLLLGWSTAFLVAVVTQIRQVNFPRFDRDGGA